MGKYQKGFTLIELLAVIVVLGIILAIAIPKITESINNSKIVAFENQKEIMLKSGKEYVQLNNIPSGIVSYDTLIKVGKLKDGIKDNKGNVLDRNNTLIDTINNKVIYSTDINEILENKIASMSNSAGLSLFDYKIYGSSV